MTASPRPGPPFPPDPRPDAETAWRRLRLALSILSHRSWCGECTRHARQIEQALNGEHIVTDAGEGE